MPKTQFTVTLENVELSKAQMTRMEKEINAIVANYVVKAATPESPLGTKLKINPEWMGIWLKKFKSIEELKANTAFKKYNQKVIG